LPRRRLVVLDLCGFANPYRELFTLFQRQLADFRLAHSQKIKWTHTYHAERDQP
jgi:hypothetical protein